MKKFRITYKFIAGEYASEIVAVQHRYQAINIAQQKSTNGFGPNVVISGKTYERAKITGYEVSSKGLNN